MKKKLNFILIVKIYLNFLKKNNLYEKRKKFFYENNIEKMENWTNVNFNKTLAWYNNIRKNNKAKIINVHLEKMRKWTYDKSKGVISHDSGEFFSIEGKRTINSKREVKSWDQQIKSGRQKRRIGRTNRNWQPKRKKRETESFCCFQKKAPCPWEFSISLYMFTSSSYVFIYAFCIFCIVFVCIFDIR